MTFHEFAAERGLIIDRIEHGRWVRVPTVDHPHKRNGAFWFGGEFGHVQNWATMDKTETWQDGKERTPFEKQDMAKRMEASRKQYQQERTRMRQEAARRAQWILGQCELDRHAYLDKKGFPELLGNVWRQEGKDPLLVVPMRFGNDICGCQLISITGEKKYLFGQRSEGAVFTIGQGGQEYLCEGYATALSLHAVLNTFAKVHTIHATFSAGNMAKIAKQHPSAILICDNDASGTGQKVGEQSGCRWWIPPDVGDDFNDMHQKIGVLQASMILKKVLA